MTGSLIDYGSATVYVGTDEGWEAIGSTAGGVEISGGSWDGTWVDVGPVEGSFTFSVTSRTLRYLDRLFGFGHFASRARKVNEMRAWSRRKGRRK